MSWRADACLGCKFYHADPAPIQLHPIPMRVCVLLCRASTFEHVCGAVALLPRRSDTRARFACCKLPSEARRRILTTANKGLKRGTAARQYDRDSSLLQICVERARMDTTPRVCNLFLLQIAIGSAVPVPTGCKCPSGERRRPSPSCRDSLGPLQTGDRRAMRLPTHRRQRLPPLQSGVGSAPSVFPAERGVLQRPNLRE